MELFILGATGRTGHQLTRQALERGHSVMAFVRSPEKMRIAHKKLQIIRGDPADTAQIKRVIGNQDAVLSALGAASHPSEAILEPASRSVVEAMRTTDVRRLVVLSMGLLFPDLGFIGPVLRFFLRHHARDSVAMEKVVEASGLDWTIVRPPQLTNGAAQGHYRSTENRAPPAHSVSRADLARAILDIVENRLSVKKVVGVSK